MAEQTCDGGCPCKAPRWASASSPRAGSGPPSAGSPCPSVPFSGNRSASPSERSPAGSAHRKERNKKKKKVTSQCRASAISDLPANAVQRKSFWWWIKKRRSVGLAIVCLWLRGLKAIPDNHPSLKSQHGFIKDCVTHITAAQQRMSPPSS